ncbi:hypothetical protein GGX14DRAFT_580730 [Mycena pura]|uniref:Lysine-specific metallo-endopeptidase domain-containing protein n=1 Tax=Mycena pura TaxID=153505 RepID=A0AAD6UKF5_9AGAR|nr:hypothetical protein GGX14DRAFT_580730 [Mycena pura]
MWPRKPKSVVFVLLTLAVPLWSSAALQMNAARDTIVTVSSSLPRLKLTPQHTDFSSFDLMVDLSSASSTSSPLLHLPSSCAQYVGAGLECAAGMTAAHVQFEDCGEPFTVCRCADAAMSLATVADRLGRVPVGLRRYAGVLFVMGTTEPGPSAYTLPSGDIHLFGDCAVDTWVHETMHAFDFSVDGSGILIQSGSPGWAAALAADTCAPDDYSLTNQVEATWKDFAQVGVLYTYTLLHGGTLPPGFVVACMAHQLAFMAALPLFDPMQLFGNDCAITNSGPAARHTKAPQTLDPSRTFGVVSTEATPLKNGNAGSTLARRSRSVQGAFMYYLVLVILQNAFKLMY